MAMEKELAAVDEDVAERGVGSGIRSKKRQAGVVYTVWIRGRSSASLGLSLTNLPRVVVLALVFAAVQFSITPLGLQPARHPRLGNAPRHGSHGRRVQVDLLPCSYRVGCKHRSASHPRSSGPRFSTVYHVGYSMRLGILPLVRGEEPLVPVATLSNVLTDAT